MVSVKFPRSAYQLHVNTTPDEEDEGYEGEVILEHFDTGDSWQRIPELDLDELRRHAHEEMGQQWCDKYGENSLRAALVVSGEVPAGEVEAYVAAYDRDRVLRDDQSGETNR